MRNATTPIHALWSLLLGACLLAVALPGWAALSAEVDRAALEEGDTLTLTITCDRAQSGTSPDLAPLRSDFDLLGTSTGTEMSIMNGHRSDTTRWIVRLQPRHTGHIRIPPIAVGNERTPALSIDVSADAGAQSPQGAMPGSPPGSTGIAQHLFIETEAAGGGGPVYVQQQVPYTVRLYYDESVQNGDLAAPDPSDAVVEQLGEDKRYTAMRDGHRYNVLERHYAISPEKSGRLHIPPATFRGRVQGERSAQGVDSPTQNLMERLLRNTPFANDPFFGKGGGMSFSFGDPGRQVSVHGPAIDFEVRPRPVAAQGRWLPAEGISLHDSWQGNPPQLKVGEPATRTITIEARGLAASQIPNLALAAPANARLYPETPHNQSRTDGRTIFGESKQSVTYIPRGAGPLDIPPVDLAWWNTKSDTQSHTGLPALELRVAPGAASAQNASPPQPVAADGTNPAATPAPAAPAQAVPASTPSSRGAMARLRAQLQAHAAWVGAAILLLLILSYFGLRLWRRRTGALQPAAPGPAAARRESPLRRLARACGENDAAAAARALLELGVDTWPADPPRGLAALAARLAGGAREVVALDRALYAAGGGAWQGGALWQACRHGLQPRPRGAMAEETDRYAPATLYRVESSASGSRQNPGGISRGARAGLDLN